MITSERLDEAIAGAALAFAANAEAARERAALADQGAGSRDHVLARGAAGRARRSREDARSWEARAREAAKGNLLLTATETNDGEFMESFKDLIISCQAAGRCVEGRTWPW